MGYVILRTAKLKSGTAVRRSLMHSFREQDTPNADPAKRAENTHIGAANTKEALERFNARLATQAKVRSNAVLAVEYLVTASPEAMHGKARQDQDAYFRDALDWLKAKHGAENVIHAGIHRDEQTPHMYAYVVPIDERGKLNCRAYLGNPKALSEMQSDFAAKVGQSHGLERGIEGSKAKHTRIQAYYTRANEAFEPLPEIRTPPAKLRPEPEKPGIFAGAEAKAIYKLDHTAWLQEQRDAQRQQQQRQAEIKAQRDAAVATARRHEAQAKEAQALRAKLDEQKRSTSRYVKATTRLEVELASAQGVASLFTPGEIKAAQERKRIQAAEAAKQAEIARKRAAEAARRAEIDRERGLRVGGLKKLLQRGGAAFTFGSKAVEALKKADGDPAKVDWSAVEGAAIREAMIEHGQSAASVIEAVNQHSPGRADPATRQDVANWVNQHARSFEQQHQQRHGRERSGPDLSR